MISLAVNETIARAVEVLRENDHGDYTIPTKGLYPFHGTGIPA
ncbi:hypothetical protein [Mesorhizobium sp.]|nr:hypothetical protein [Mesorhizobium sp.]